MSATHHRPPLRLGCIADDFTGATDLANNLVRAGMRVLQTIGVPTQALDADVDAVVVALKSRTVPAAEAVALSLQALNWLRQQGAGQIYFKYCSTFDSTAAGNIGPVMDALGSALGSHFTVATPAFPDNQRTVFKGYLFAGDGLLNECGMQNHPLTPMSDPNLVRVLQAQTRSRVGLIDYQIVAQGVQAVRQRMQDLQGEGVQAAIVDAIRNEDLLTLGEAFSGLALLTGGSGLALGLPANFGLVPSEEAGRLPPAQGFQAVLAGSCSRATRAQLRHFQQSGLPCWALDPLKLAQGEPLVEQALAWAKPWLGRAPVLLYASADPEVVHSIQAKLGVDAAGSMVEQALAAIACGLVQAGVGQLVVAGGETSGACVQALGIREMQIGPQIDPGVPWCWAPSRHGALHLTLKSGNFGAEDFFLKAFKQLSLPA